jgi:hypothetical protein
METIYVVFDGTSFFMAYQELLNEDPSLEVHGEFSDIENASDFCDLKNLEV